MTEWELRELISQYASMQELQPMVDSFDVVPMADAPSADHCSATDAATQTAICAGLPFSPLWQNITHSAMFQATAASIIPTMGAEATLTFNSLNLTMVLTKDTLGNLKQKAYALEYNGMQAEVTFPDTFQPVKLSLFLEAATSGDIMSIYELPALPNNATMAFAFTLTNGNTSAPMFIDPVDAVPQISSLGVHVPPTNEIEPIFARSMKYPPKSFMSVLISTAEIKDKRVADRIANAYGLPECSRLDLETGGVYTQNGMMEPNNSAVFTPREDNPNRYTIRCDTDRLDMVDHTSVTVLFVKPVSWGTLVFACIVVGLGALILFFMIATDANAICAGRPMVFQPIDFSKRGSLFSELLRNHMWLSLLFGIIDNVRTTKGIDPTTGNFVKLPTEWSIRKYQNVFIWASSLISYSVGAMAMASSLRSPSYFPLDTNVNKYLIQNYWIACIACAIACGKGVHIILSFVFSKIQITFPKIKVHQTTESEMPERKAGHFTPSNVLEMIILGRPLHILWNVIPILLCIFFIAGMCFCTIYLGLDYDWQATYLWIIGAVSAVILDVLVLDPALIGLHAMVLSFFQSTQVPTESKAKPLSLTKETAAHTIADINGTDDKDIELHDPKINYASVQSKTEEESPKDKMPPPLQKEEEPEKKHARDNWVVWFLTLITWEYMTPMTLKGIFKPLTVDDFQGISVDDKSDTLIARFSIVWEPLRKSTNNGAVLIRAFFATFGARFFLAVLLRFLSDGLTVISPLIMQELIKYLVDLSLDPLPGYLLIVAMFLSNYLSATFQNQSFDVATRLGMNIRTTLASSVYRKSLVLSNKARQTRSTGQIVNLMSIDAEKFQLVMPFLPFVITAFFQIVVALAILFYYLKLAAFFSIGIMIALIPLNIVLMGFFQSLRKKVLFNTDRRVKSINELLQSIRIVKFFAWEDSFESHIGKIRRYELIQFVGLAVCRAVLGVVLQGAPIFISVGTFGLYAIIYGQDQLTPELVFPSMAYLNILRFPMTMMPMLLALCIDLSVSLGRIGSFLQEDELQKDASTSIVENADGLKNSVVIENGCFEWEVPDEEKKSLNMLQRWKQKREAKKQAAKESSADTKDDTESKLQVELELHEKTIPDAGTDAAGVIEEDEQLAHVDKDVGKLLDINLTIPKGSLTVIVGTVGAGKSSLLSSLIGDMKKTQGTVTLAGSVAYCAQSAWIINDTVRGNITFGKPYDEEEYQNIIKVCALRNDLQILTAGDQTEIGEKGINLSGGQRQRVSLARAVYSDADVYLLDDPLSAVDAHVGKYLFDECVLGRLKNKTRILVTHQLQHIHKADCIVVMDNGRIVEQGEFDELMKYGPDGTLAKIMEELQQHQSDDVEEEKEEKESVAVAKTHETEEGQVEKTTQAEDDDGVLGALMTLEERTTGRLTVKNVMFYVMATGGPIVAAILAVLYAISQTGILMADWWLTQWTSNKYTYLDLGQYFGIYIGIGAVAMVLLFFRDSIFASVGVLGSKRLHEKMLKRIIRAPSAFFDTTPLGRILNRFSKDMESVDQILGQTLTQFFSITLQTIGNCVLMIVAMYWLSIPLVIFAVVYFIIQQIYTSTYRELKRIDAITRSPVYSHFSESLTGLSSIRAYRRQQDFIDKFDDRLDINIGAFRMQNDMQRWLSFRLDILGSLCTFAVGMMAMLLRNSGTVDPSLMSLALTYSLAMTNMLAFMVRNSTEAEAAFASVERIAYYVAHVPEEPDAINMDNRPPESWPDKGEIVFDNVEARYRPGLPLVIKGISMSIKSNEKIGVVGRTGSGKSTIMLLLFRMFDVASGNITIDGININDIGLRDLRKKLAIIPQEPTLFTGTVRSNLDPFNEYADKYLWEALERAHLKDAIEKLEKGLDSPVSENGDNFSVGQRQLMCLARALCKQSKVLILDEASASLDFATDTLIQKTVREAFADCTCLTIAHRLNTIIDSDRVLVLEQGEIVEMDTPRNLFENHPDGVFSSLVGETGQANAKLLRSIAMGDITFDSALEEMRKLQEEEQEEKENDLVMGGADEPKQGETSEPESKKEESFDTADPKKEEQSGSDSEKEESKPESKKEESFDTADPKKEERSGSDSEKEE